MRINKKKFFSRMFILALIIGLLIYARHITVNNGWTGIAEYYKGLIGSFKGDSTTYLMAQKFFIIKTDKTLRSFKVFSRIG
jgi:uncharacterized membrane protein